MRHALLATLVVLVPLAADAKPKKGKAKGKNPKVEFKKHLDKGTKAHKAGKFDVALTELQAAYAIDPQPKLLFAIGQVQVKLDNCPDAVVSYRSFLESTKDKQKQAIVKQAITSCNEKIAAATPTAEPPSEDMLVPPTVTEQPPAPAEPAPPPAPVEPDPIVDDSPLPPMQPATVSGAKPWYKDVLGDALVLTGVAAGVVSVVMYTGARSSLDDAESAPTLADYQDNVDIANDKRMYSVLFAGASAVLISAGIVRYNLRNKGETRGIAVAPTSGGGMITWKGGF